MGDDETRSEEVSEGDRKPNTFWRRNKSFPAQYGGEDETPDPEETLTFWRSINNKEVSEG